MPMNEHPTTKQLSNEMCERLKEQQAQREYNRRKGIVEVLVKQNRGNVPAAIEQYKIELCKKLKEIPPAILRDLDRIGEELVRDGAATA
jgi:hypothetical protein